MKFVKLEKINDGLYLKNYELTYLNKIGKEKKYEIVSRKELKEVSDIGREVSGVSIAARQGDKLLLLREFRMSVNKTIYNFCAGMLDYGETLEDCIKRELYEETGLSIKKIIRILPSSYSAVGISDTKTYMAFVEAEGEFEDHTSVNEKITAKFYTREEVKKLLETEEFSSRTQILAYLFAYGTDDEWK